MAPPVNFRVLTLVFLLSFFIVSPAQDLNSLKAGVVRIVNTRTRSIGTGFIVKITKDRIYIVTSSHVVSGNDHPHIYLYNRQLDPLSADVQDIEEDGLKGLALLTLKSNEETFAGITEFNFRESSQLEGGENITIIGFPNSTSLWTVSNATVARIEGRNLVFSGTILEGNSGGPVVLNGQVIGLVTDVSQGLAYAARSESIVSYINGIVRNLVVAKPTASPSIIPNDDFCEALKKLLDSSKGGFYSIVGDPTPGYPNFFSSNITLPGGIQGFVRPQEEVFYYLLIDKDKGKVQSQFYRSVSKVKGCLPGSEEKEETGSIYKYHKFRETKGTTVVKVYYNPTALKENHYYLFLALAVDSLARRNW